MPPSESAQAGEEQNPPVPEKVAKLLRDAILERLKTYSEAFSVTAGVYGTASVNNQDPSVFVVECDRLLRDIIHLNNMAVPGRLSVLSLFVVMLLAFAIISFFADLTKPDKPPRILYWQDAVKAFFSGGCLGLMGGKIFHQFSVLRVKATLEKIKIKVMNKEPVSPQEIAELERWYWDFIIWKEQTPDV